MQRYSMIDTGNLINPKQMAESQHGQWVKHDDIVNLDSKAKQLGYDSIDDALSALAVYRENEGY